MMTTKILNPDETYTFSKYFELKIEAKDLAKEFGFSFERKRLNLPQYAGELDRVEQTQSRIDEILPYVSLTNESARREWLVSPVLRDLIYYTKVEIRIEYPIKVSKYLQGNLDYFLESSNQILIVEAKKADLEFGMTQLVSQLVTLDQWQEDPKQTYFIGAVTTGVIWQFAYLHRQSKHIEQGLETYRVPDDLDSLMRILVQAVNVN
jgi:hypothetical protein